MVSQPIQPAVPFPADILRRRVVAQGYEFRVAQMVGLRLILHLFVGWVVGQFAFSRSHGTARRAARSASSSLPWMPETRKAPKSARLIRLRREDLRNLHPILHIHRSHSRGPMMDARRLPTARSMRFMKTIRSIGPPVEEILAAGH